MQDRDMGNTSRAVQAVQGAMVEQAVQRSRVEQ